MSVVPHRDRRAERYAVTRREILDAAWQLVRADGLASLAMRDLGAQVGMRAQSLYAYFPSKFAIYDAMFGDANRELLQRLRDIPAANDPIAGLRRQTAMFLEFCVEDPVRYQLLFQRTIPGFEPSPDSFAPAIEILEFGRRALRACGIDDATALDSWTAVTGGIAAQQNSNEPGGDRWVRRVDDITDMFLAYYQPRRRQEKS
jgi:AcrR family transcriptional regulator